ncbi:MAG: PIN domain-containing protein [Acidimicrobiia bacterium]|nr:PIN domain-containing protein [Acidimicrobiia bacterium]
MIRFADTSFWFGLYTKADARHSDAVTLWRSTTDRVVTSNLVLGETWTLLLLRRTSHGRAMALLDAIWQSPRVEVARIDESDEERAWSWLRMHDERACSFVDATSYALMRRRRIHEALAFDGDFSAAGFVEARTDHP